MFQHEPPAKLDPPAVVADLSEIENRIARGQLVGEHQFHKPPQQARVPHLSQRGLGLGLSLVKAVVEAHQGQVSVSSRVGEGAEFTVIQGRQVPGSTNGDGAIRCAYLTEGAVLSGLTLANGATRIEGGFWEERNGGGVWCTSSNACLSNCVLSGDSAYFLGGGAYGGATMHHCTITGNIAGTYGGGVYLGTLRDCTITRNSAYSGGGVDGCALDHCTINDNSAQDSGGGAEGGTLNDCMLLGNLARGDGGAATFAALRYCRLANNRAGYRGGGTYYSTLTACEIIENSAEWLGGGVCRGTLNNCLLDSNQAEEGGAAFGATVNSCILSNNSADEDGGGASRSALNNCTLSANSAGDAGGGSYISLLANCTIVHNSANGYGGGDYASILTNCVVYFNSAPEGSNYLAATSTLDYCCTWPRPPSGYGNITNEPLFLDLTDGDLRLQSISPCINAGRNVDAAAGTDLGGNPRIFGGTVDIGAYEFQAPASIISYAWLEQFGLPTDGSADFADTDGDGLNNWQEWRCGTEPTNRLSVLQLLPPARVGNDVIVTWESVPGQSYFLEQSRTLRPQPCFEPLARNIAAQGGTTTYTHTNAAGGDARFYHIGVEQASR